jgi:serine/threonine-protein kinase
MAYDLGTGPFTVGTVFAGYRILGVLGRGGMGVVYRAEDLNLGRQVALKVLSPHVADEPAFRERFLREPRLLASIEHRNIVDVFHADQVDGIAFLAMRLIDGVDLGRLIRDRGRLDPAAVSHIVAEVGDALDAAHARGLVHRDVKPANILVVEGGGRLDAARVYLTDFGLTKLNDAPTDLTLTGQFLGTVDYVAPEQIQGAAVDGRTDLYALACVAYECLAGAPPFGEALEAAALMAHLVSPPPDISFIRSDLPPAVAAVLMRGMAKRRDERHATCSEFARALSQALAGTGPTPIVSPSPDLPVTRPVVPVAPPVVPVTRPVVPAAPPFLASRFPPDPAWAGAKTVRTALPPAQPAEPIRPRPRYVPPPSYDDAPYVADDYPYETEYGVSRRGGLGRRRRRGLGRLLVTALALLLLAGGGVTFALALRDRGLLPGIGGATSSPQASSSATLDPAAARRELRGHIPQALRPMCRPVEAVAPALAVQACDVESGRVTIRYSLMADAETMVAEYAAVRSQLGVPPDSGRAGERCIDQSNWPNEGQYTASNVPTGRLLCTLVGGWARFEWTDHRSNVLTSVTDTSGDGRRLFRLWRDGRLPPASATPAPTAPTPTPDAGPTDPPQAPSEQTPPPEAGPTDAGQPGATDEPAGG